MRRVRHAGSSRGSRPDVYGCFKQGGCMKRIYQLAGAAALMCSIGTSAQAQTREKGEWWPNAQWGVGDQAGASNWITPEKVLAATALVKTGRVIELGHLYERGMPLNG